MELYQEIKCSERLPAEERYYYVKMGFMLYVPAKKMFVHDANYIRPETAEYWLEKVELSNQEELWEKVGYTILSTQLRPSDETVRELSSKYLLIKK